MDYLKHRGKYAPAALSPMPGLLLLDLNMPKKDGWEVLREVKSDPALRSIPVVILTTSKEDEDHQGGGKIDQRPERRPAARLAGRV